jgi:hypothetical protein
VTLTMKLVLCLALLTSEAIWAKQIRSAAAVKEFKRENPCPTTGLKRGACLGYQVDHIDPLCMGGLDTKENMQWLSVEDHRFKTFTDIRACRKLREAAGQPAR